MKKKTKQLFSSEQSSKKAAEQEKETEPLQDVTEFSASDIASYHYVNPQTELGFLVTENGYANDEDEKFPVNQASVEGQLTAIGDLTCLRVIGNEKKKTLA